MKLSKRHGAMSINEYQEQGYLPETIIYFLALLRWSLDDKTEILSRQELVENFSLRSSAIGELKLLGINYTNYLPDITITVRTAYQLKGHSIV